MLRTVRRNWETKALPVHQKTIEPDDSWEQNYEPMVRCRRAIRASGQNCQLTLKDLNASTGADWCHQ